MKKLPHSSITSQSSTTSINRSIIQSSGACSAFGTQAQVPVPEVIDRGISGAEFKARPFHPVLLKLKQVTHCTGVYDRDTDVMNEIVVMHEDASRKLAGPYHLSIRWPTNAMLRLVVSRYPLPSDPETYPVSTIADKDMDTCFYVLVISREKGTATLVSVVDPRSTMVLSI